MGAYDSDISTSRYLKTLVSLRDRLELIPEEISIAGTHRPPDTLSTLKRLLDRFHTVVSQLRHRFDKRSTLEVRDEHDVQDLLHALLRIHFDDVRPEEWTPSYAGGSSRMDFLLKREQVVVEAKMTRGGLGAKEVRDQLATDILRYQAHPGCKSLVCFVYDPEQLVQNPKGVADDLSQLAGKIQVRIHIAQT